MTPKFEYEYKPQTHFGLKCLHLSATQQHQICRTRVMLIGIFYKVGIKMRDGNSLKFQLKGLAMWHRELLSFKTYKGGAHENSLSPSTSFHSPQKKCINAK